MNVQAPPVQVYHVSKVAVLDFLRGLPPSHKEPVRDAIDNLESNPYPAGHTKEVRQKMEIYRYPVKSTKYRLVYLIFDIEKFVDVISIEIFSS